MSLMFARSRCLRLSSPLTSLSRASPTAMPLRAKVTNPAITGRAPMATAPPVIREEPGDEPDDVLFRPLYGVRSFELNRPKKLNSLNGSMIRKILPRLEELRRSDLANVVVMSGAGPKAFCAGGDVASLAKQNQEGPEGQKKSKDFFGLEYQLDHLIATYPKPYIAILDGITMGGGVGLSVHAQFRIATEKTVFAMPETTIGFFPDVGGSFFLPRMDGEVGTYLALTSERLTGVQAYYAGIATHYFHSSSLANLINRLGELVFRDKAPLSERLALVNRTIAEFSTGLPPLDEEPILFSGSLRRAIDRCFCHDTIEAIVSHLEREQEEREWAEKTLQTLTSRSPTSLKVTLRALRLGRHWGIAETFQREHHIAGHFMAHPDFVEGVTARLINKPATEPKWTPASLQDVTSEDVDRFFRIPPGEGRLQLLTRPGDYKEYPHARYALPSETAVIRRVAEGKARHKDEIVGEFVQEWEGKDGVASKVEEILERRTEETKDGLRIV